jgi:iron complex transport system substrate-binding protein
MTRSSRPIAVLIVATLVAAAGCGATVESSSGTPPGSGSMPAGPVTVVNCGKEVTYQRVPERAVAYDIGMVEMMFSLGLAPRMRGWVINSIYGDVNKSPYAADFARVERLGDSRIGLEMVLNAKADWVFAGHNHGFVESRGITPAILANNGVESYTLTETCPTGVESEKGTMPSLDALYADYRNLGRIFAVPDRAEAIIADMERRFTNAAARKPSRPARVMAYSPYEDKPYVAGGSSIMTAIIEKAGGTNIYGKDVKTTWASVGWETAVAADPEVIVMIDYDDMPYEAKIQNLMDNPSMRATSAVRNNRILRLDFAYTMAGPRAGEAAEKSAASLRSVGL